jgi:hypothetical protein
MFRKQAIKMLSANGRTSACVKLGDSVSRVTRPGYMSGLQDHAILLDEENSLDGDGGVRVDYVVGRFQVANQ